MEASSNNQNGSLESDLESFQRVVTELFHDLASSNHEDMLSLSWVSKVLDCFLCCHENFRMVLLQSHALKSSTSDRLVADYFERSVKALDVCNAIRDGIEQIRQWQRLLEIVVCALDRERTVGEAQFRRAKKALIDLAIGMLDEKDSSNSNSSTGSSLAYRNRSFGRTKDSHNSHFRSLSWSVSRTWSAARQIQAIGNNLSPPKGNDVVATYGLAQAIYTMNAVLFFSMWALVAAIPCQDRGLQVSFSVPRNFTWAGPMMFLHERIMEESKKRERKNACGLLKEIHQIEKCARVMNELSDSVQFPLTQKKEVEVMQRVKEVSEVCGALKNGLDPLEQQVREVFHRIVRSRTEGLDSLGRPNFAE